MKTGIRTRKTALPLMETMNDQTHQTRQESEMSEQNQTKLKYEIGRIEDLLDRCSHSDAWIDGMIDIKFRNVKVEDAQAAAHRIQHFMKNYSERRGQYHGVSYSVVSWPGSGGNFYVYRTEHTVVCVGDYADSRHSVDK